MANENTPSAPSPAPMSELRPLNIDGLPPDADFLAAAVSYCIAVNLDPKELIQIPHPEGMAVLYARTRRMVIASELRDQALRMLIIKAHNLVP